MKTLLSLISTVAFTASVALAADKEVTITGEGKCGKCALKKTDECQNVVEVKDGDKIKLYYLTGDISKAFHDNLCKSTAKVKATGIQTEKDGKMMIAVTKIAKAE
jgi:hypothetical protein